MGQESIVIPLLIALVIYPGEVMNFISKMQNAGSQIAVLSAFAFGCAMFIALPDSLQNSAPGNSAGNPARLRVQHASYLAEPVDDVIRQADFIVSGKVAYISESSWNQDGGEFWDGTQGDMASLQLHHMVIEIQNAYRSPGEIDEFIDVSIIGPSPLDDAESQNPFFVGDSAVFFLNRTDLPYRGGRRPAVIFTGAPELAHMKQLADTLVFDWLPDDLRGQWSAGTMSMDEFLSFVGAK